MKKSLLIGTIVVLVLAIAGGAIAFAVWDKTTSNIDITVANVASNVKVEANAIANTSDNKNLIPSVAVIRGANDAETVKIGEFEVILSSDNSAATPAQLADKVMATYSITGVTVDGVAVELNDSGNTYDWNRYLEIIVSANDDATSGKITDNILTLKSDNSTTPFYAFVKFKDFAIGYSETEQAYIRSLSGKQFVISMQIKIESKTVAA